MRIFWEMNKVIEKKTVGTRLDAARGIMLMQGGERKIRRLM